MNADDRGADFLGDVLDRRCQADRQLLALIRIMGVCLGRGRPRRKSQDDAQNRSRYGDGSRWPEIYEANRSEIVDPDLIYPGQVFAIPF